MSEQSKFRDRKFVAVLYPEDFTHVACIEKLMHGGYNFGAILHDKDIYEDGDHAGELKKPHWHVVLRYKNAVWNTSVAKELGIEQNYLQPCRNVDSALVYLVHYGNDEKHQYDLEQVFGPLQTRLAALLADDDESTRALNIYDLIRNSPGIVTYTEVFEKACKSGLYGDFRRMGTGVKWLIDEHNACIEFEYDERRKTSVPKFRDKFVDFVKVGYPGKWVDAAKWHDKNDGPIKPL